jgi:hypothetical protein
MPEGVRLVVPCVRRVGASVGCLGECRGDLSTTRVVIGVSQRAIPGEAALLSPAAARSLTECCDGEDHCLHDDAPERRRARQADSGDDLQCDTQRMGGESSARATSFSTLAGACRSAPDDERDADAQHEEAAEAEREATHRPADQHTLESAAPQRCSLSLAGRCLSRSLARADLNAILTPRGGEGLGDARGEERLHTGRGGTRAYCCYRRDVHMRE